jgi:hypothetical protein
MLLKTSGENVVRWWRTNPVDWPGAILLSLALACAVPPVFFAMGGYNIAAMLWACLAISVWSILGSWTGSGFPFFFDFLAMQVMLCSIGTILWVAWGWIKPVFAN